jgi:hypothetical protein
MMIRTAVLSTAILIAFAAQTLAQDTDKDAECRKQGQIATNIVAERTNGSNLRRAERRVIRALPDDAKKYEVAIPALAEWIYSLPEDQMTAGVSNVIYQSCMSQ